MSSVGADINARTTGSGAAGMPRYLRVKGESEAAVTSQGPAVVSIFRPAMIIGSRHTPWLLAAVLPLFALVTPVKFRSIRTTEIAEAMVAVALHPTAVTILPASALLMSVLSATAPLRSSRFMSKLHVNSLVR
jgi:uncharacterized protein YbjT (DUF2867 family)